MGRPEDVLDRLRERTAALELAAACDGEAAVVEWTVVRDVFVDHYRLLVLDAAANVVGSVDLPPEGEGESPLDPDMVRACAPVCTVALVAVDGAARATEPVLAASLTVDADGDGFVAVACGGDDCDDDDPAVFPGAPEVCDGRDTSCSGTVDDVDPSSAPLLENQAGVCEGVRQVCVGGVWQDPELDTIPGWSAVERCDGQDNTCSGTVDDVDPSSGPLAQNQEGVCEGTRQACVDGAWQEPDYATAVDGYELIRADHGLFCWGSNAGGQLAAGTVDALLEPTRVGLRPWRLLAGGAAHTCGIQHDDTLWCWGGNAHGQAGADVPSVQDPVAIPGDFASVAAGSRHTCAVDDGGGLWCWGDDASGQLGVGGTEGGPIPVAVSGTDWADVTAGDAHTCALTGVGELSCWGHGEDGRLGDGSGVSRATPVAVMGTWQQVSAGGAHTCALAGDGALLCWGAGAEGQIGDGMGQDTLAPVRVGEATYSAVAAGDAHTCAIRADDGSLWCWGRGEAGQLGHGTFVESDVPVAVDVAGAFVAVFAGNEHTCATRADETLWCWGAGAAGQLGDGTETDTPVPVQVAGDLTLEAIAVGGDHVCAMKVVYGEASCNGLDNSCDGIVDNVVVAPLAQKQDGVCAGARQACVGGSWQEPDYANAVPGYFEVEPCDGRDNACDGVVDTPYPEKWTVCQGEGVGHCAGEGLFLCRADGTGLFCSAEPEEPQEEVCDGTDNSCSGEIDDVPIENRPLASKQDGVCADARMECVNGLWVEPDYHQIDGYEEAVAGERIVCWGHGDDGQLGRPSDWHVAEPVQVGQEVWRDAGSGQAHTCGIRDDGSLWCWGFWRYLGDGGLAGSVGYPVPVVLPEGAPEAFVALEAGYAFTCALGDDGSLWCWGNNTFGQLAWDGGDIAYHPVKVGDGGWARVSGGLLHTCAIHEVDGSLWCWGRNGHGQLGDGTFDDRSVLAEVPGGPWVDVTAGQYHTCAIDTAGELWCWGEVADGALGATYPANRPNPTRVEVGAAAVVSVTAGHRFTCAIDAEGLLWCWGRNADGQLGDGTRVNRATPEPVHPTRRWRGLSAGYDHVCAVRWDESLWCWGGNSYGNVGQPSSIRRIVDPTQVGEESWSWVRGGDWSTCGRKLDGSLWCWGSNNEGMLGADHGQALRPTAPVPGYGYVTVAAGGGHTCALDEDGAVWCWGANWYGEIGDGTTTTHLDPVQATDEGHAGLTTGWYHTCALRDGALYCWGAGWSGQLGNGTGDNSLEPIRIGTDEWLTVDAGGSVTCGIQADHSLWCWGRNNSGQVGSGSEENVVNAPEAVASGESFDTVSTGGAHGCAVRLDGSLWCWGRNVHGQLGDGTTESSSVPVPVATPDGVIWRAVSAGDSHTCAIDTDDAIWCWGWNAYGTVGDGTLDSRHTPEPVASGPWETVMAGIYETCATPRETGGLWCWGTRRFPGGHGPELLVPTQVLDGDWLVADSVWHTCAVSGRRGEATCDGVDNSCDGVIDNVVAAPLADQQEGVCAGARKTCILDDEGVASWVEPDYTLIDGYVADPELAPCDGRDNACTGTVDENFPDVGALCAVGDGECRRVGRTVCASDGAEAICAVTPGEPSAERCDGLDNSCSGDVDDIDPANIPLADRQASICEGTQKRCAGEAGWIEPDYGSLVDGFSEAYAGEAWTCWGRNNYGQIGTESRSEVPVPSFVMAGRFAEIAAGNRSSFAGHTCAIHADDRTLWCWGTNTYGEVGDGVGVSRPTPVQIDDESQWVAVTAGGQGAAAHSCGIQADGSLWCWGRNASGQLGVTGTANRLSPVPVGAASWQAIAAGGHHSCGIQEDGLMWCWGRGSEGQRGDGETASGWAAVQVTEWRWIAVTAGQFHTCAVREDETLWCWGRGTSGQLGAGDFESSTTPVQVLGGVTTWRTVVAGDNHNCAIGADETLWCWGRGLDGTLGHGELVDEAAPVPVDPMRRWTAVAAGENHSCAIRRDGTAWCWGRERYGQIGNGTVLFSGIQTTPHPVSTSSTWQRISAGPAHSCAIASDGSVWCWGYNGATGQIGDGTNDYPRRLVDLERHYTSMAAGKFHTCGIAEEDAALWCWGDNWNGQLGDGTRTSSQSPVAVNGAGPWRSLSGGGDHTCAIQETGGTLWCWGLNSSGQLGDATTTRRTSPVEIQGDAAGAAWRFVDAGDRHTCAILESNGALYCWGSRANGRLGDGETSGTQTTPALIDAGPWRTVSAADSFTCGIKETDASLWCWGNRGLGRVGDGENSGEQTTPAQIHDGRWLTVWAAGSNTCAIQEEGSVWCWGNNSSRQLGPTPNNNVWAVPILVHAGPFVDVVGSHSHHCVLDEARAVYCWGLSEYGQLGEHAVLSSSRLLEVSDGPVLALTAGVEGHTCIQHRRVGETVCNGVDSNCDGTVDNLIDAPLADNQYGVCARSRKTCVPDGEGGVAEWLEPDYGLIDGYVADPAEAPCDGRDNACTGTIDGNYPDKGTACSVGTGECERTGTYVCDAEGTSVVCTVGEDDAGEPRSEDCDGLDNSCSGTVDDVPLEDRPLADLQEGVCADTLKACAGADGWVEPDYAEEVEGYAQVVRHLDVWCWGENAHGQLGHDDGAARSHARPVLAADFREMVSGRRHVCGIRDDDGTLWCWGSNYGGQLGDAATESTAAPVQIGTAAWRAVAGGGRHTCAIDEDEHLWCWGSNDEGQLGQGNQVSSTEPVLVGPTEEPWTWSQVTTGFIHTCAIRSDDSLWCWGNNGQGRLGDGTTTRRTSPVPIDEAGEGWSWISAGDAHTCGVRTGGSLWCWGAGGSWRLGNASTANRSSPWPIAEGTTWQSVAAGGIHTCGLQSDGSLWCWGAGARGQVGLGGTGNRSTPGLVDGGVWHRVTTGYTHSCATDGSDRLWCWGANEAGQIGDGTFEDRLVPVHLEGASWQPVSAGFTHTCAIRVLRGEPECDGIDTDCDGVEDNVVTGPRAEKQLGVCAGALQVCAPGGGFQEPDYGLIAGYEAIEVSCDGLDNDCDGIVGNVNWAPGADRQGGVCGDALKWCDAEGNWIEPDYSLIEDFEWVETTCDGLDNDCSGDADILVVDDPDTTDLWCWGQGRTWGPTVVDDGEWAVVAGGREATCGIRPDGSLWCWGESEVEALSIPGLWADLTVGEAHACALTEDGALWCWGDDGLLDGVALTRIGTGTWKAAAAGGAHTCAIDDADRLWCWGAGSAGQLGDGAGEDRLAPVRVLDGDATWLHVAAGQDHTCGIALDEGAGRLWCWGRNNYAQLGDASTANALAPVRPADEDASWLTVSAGTDHTCAIQDDETLWCWGRRAGGRIGNGGSVSGNSTTPAQVSGAAWTHVVAAEQHSCGLRGVDGVLLCWGRREEGRVGDLTSATANQTTPAQIGTGWQDLGRGFAHTCAIDLEDGLYCWGRNDDLQVVWRGDPGFKAPAPWTAVTVGGHHGCAIDATSADVYCWGRNLYGQVVPPATDAIEELAPTLAVTGEFASVSVGRFHSCALETDGTLWCWGANGNGRLGTGNTTVQAAPVQPGDASWRWKQASAGGFHTCAIRRDDGEGEGPGEADGALYCWGWNSQGRLGDGTTTQRTSPTAVQPVDWRWRQVFAGRDATCGIRDDGTLWCWGDGTLQASNRSLGLGTDPSSDNRRPAQVGVAAWDEVSVGGGHICAVRDRDATLWCWGSNASGELGVPSAGARAEYATRLPGRWLSVTTGFAHTCGKQVDGSLWCWGAGAMGAVGDGVFQATHPEPVALSEGVADVAAGHGLTCARYADPMDDASICF